MAITIGAGAADYGTFVGPGYTWIDRNGPASGSGTITSFEIWNYSTGSGVKMGTFYGSGTTYTNRDYETLGSITAGSKQTFTGLNCDCQSGDLIGWYSSGGRVEVDQSGSLVSLYKPGDMFGTGSQSYSNGTDYYKFALYGTGGVEALPVINYHFNNMRP